MAGADPAERVHARVVGDPVELPGGHVLVQEFDAHIRYLADGSMALDAIRVDDPLPPLAPGQALKMSRAVVGDATYVWDAHVTEVINPATRSVRLGVDGPPSRVQQRDHVRVNTPAFPVTLTLVVDPPDGTPEAQLEPCLASMRDVSAGGTRIVLAPRIDVRSFAVGDVLRVQVELVHAGDDAVDVDLQARVRWVGDVEGHQTLGLMFLRVPRVMATRMTRWVFAEEARQSRMTRR